MVLEPLTLEEVARHERGIAKLRRRLFRKYQPTDYFIVPSSERVLAASAESRWNAACGSYRVFTFGGLGYSVDCRDPAGLCEFRVSHFDADVFTFWLRAAKGHSVTALDIRFRELDDTVYAYVRSYRHANVHPMYGVRKD